MAIVIYDLSCTGTTAGVAERIATDLGIGHEPIRPESGELPNPRGIGIFFGGMVTIIGRKRATRPPEVKAGPDDLVVLGSPVWAGRPPALMRGFLDHLDPKPRRWAAFLTLGGAGADSTFLELTERMGSAPVATLALTKKDFDTGADADKVTAFVEKLKAKAAKAPSQKQTAASPGAASD